MKAIIRNTDCTYTYDIVTLAKKDGNIFVTDYIKKSITLEAAQAYFGVDASESYIDSEGDKIA